MRTARLDHDAMGGTAPVPMGSIVSQPFHVTAGCVRHPASQPTSDVDPMPINVDWRLVLEKLGMTDPEVAAATGRERTTVRKWHSGQRMPPIDAQRELARLWESRVGGPLPGQRSPGSTAAAIGAIAPRKRRRPPKNREEIAPAPLSAAELLGRVQHRVAEPTRVVEKMRSEDRTHSALSDRARAEQGRRIKAARKKIGITVKEVVARLRVSNSALWNYECGHVAIPPALYDRIAAALGLPADWHVVTA